MSKEDIVSLLQSSLTGKTEVIPLNGAYKIIFPFTDYMNDTVEIYASLEDDLIHLSDMGHTAGLLFSLGQHAEDTPAHQLVKNLSRAYNINVNYDRGILSQNIPVTDDMSGMLDFVKVVLSLQTAIPELRQYKVTKSRRSRLATRLAKDVQQLSMPTYVERQVEVSGKHLKWVINYKYAQRKPEDVDILLVAADLGLRDPRIKVEHVLTMALDLMELDYRYDLRVVYETNGSRNDSPAQAAAQLIEDSQPRLNYKAYNYGDLNKKGEWMNLTLQELLPLM